MLDDFKVILYEYRAALKRTITPPEKYNGMFKNKSYIGISFIILIFGIYAIPKIVERIKNDKVVQGDRLDSVNPVAVSEGQLLK
jgi:hypothetical protein